MITAEECLINQEFYDNNELSQWQVEKAMIEFAKLHAVEILKKLSKTEIEYQRNIQYIYPLSNIK